MSRYETLWEEMRAAGVGAMLAFYKRVLSPAIHAVGLVQGGCGYQPSCSDYAAIAIAEHGVFRGGMMAVSRLLRCHPLHPGGFDPVPAKHNKRRVAASGRAIS